MNSFSLIECKFFFLAQILEFRLTDEANIESLYNNLNPSFQLGFLNRLDTERSFTADKSPSGCPPEVSLGI